MRIDINIDLDTPYGYLEGVPAEFEIDAETYPAEPYSWGGSRGEETAVAARFQSLELGPIKMNANELGAWLGFEYLAKLEEQVEEEWYEN